MSDVKHYHNKEDVAYSVQELALNRLTKIESLSKIETLCEMDICESMIFAHFSLALLALPVYEAKSRTIKLNSRFPVPIRSSLLEEMFSRVVSRREKEYSELHKISYMFSDRVLTQKFLHLTEEEALEAGFLKSYVQRKEGKRHNELAKKRDAIIIDMWVNEAATASEISKKLQGEGYTGCSVATVKRRLKSYGLTRKRDVDTSTIVIQERYQRKQINKCEDCNCNLNLRFEEKDNLSEVEEALKSNQNLAILGLAGSGKTTCIDFLRNYLKENGKTYKVVASLGCAADCAGGETIHHFLKISPKDTICVDKRGYTNLRKIDTLIIDEIGTVSVHLFSRILKMIQKIKKIYHHDIRLVVLGDFLQLSDKSNKLSVWNCFGWIRNIDKVIYLHGSKRIDDLSFLKGVRNIAFGANVQSTIESLNDKIEINHTAYNELDLSGAVYLTSYRKDAEKINDLYVKKHVNDKSYQYLIADRQNDQKNAHYSVEELIPVYLGMPIMTVKNTSTYKNGTRGKIVAINDNYT